MVKRLELLWTRITNIGIDGTDLGREVVKARLLNQLIVLALVTSLLALGTYIVFYEGLTIIFTTLANIAMEITGLALAFRKQHKMARNLACFAFPALVSFHIVLLGGNFGEANIFIGLGLAAFILFEGMRRLQIISVLYIITLFTSAELYTIQQNYTNNFAGNPYDDIITFIMILVVLALIIFLYQRELKNYEQQKLELIASLEDKNKALNTINKELEQFTYIASHDLKTPLRTISSHLDLIRWHLDRKDMEAVDVDIAFAKNSTNRLYSLIDGILEYKKVSGNKAGPESIDLNEVFEETRQILFHQIQNKNGEVVAANLPAVNGVRSEFQVLFQNLIENGLKFNKSEKPKVEVSWSEEEQYLCLHFADNGIGIEEIYHDKIFMFFKRLHTIEEYEGNGIGLGLCQKIVQKYNGYLDVASAPGTGARFRMCLPKSMMSEYRSLPA